AGPASERERLRRPRGGLVVHRAQGIRGLLQGRGPRPGDAPDLGRRAWVLMSHLTPRAQVTPDTAMRPSRNPGSTNSGTFRRRPISLQDGVVPSHRINSRSQAIAPPRAVVLSHQNSAPNPSLTTTLFSSPGSAERTTRVCKLKGVTHAPSALCPLRG